MHQRHHSTFHFSKHILYCIHPFILRVPNIFNCITFITVTQRSIFTIRTRNGKTPQKFWRETFQKKKKNFSSLVVISQLHILAFFVCFVRVCVLRVLLTLLCALPTTLSFRNTHYNRHQRHHRPPSHHYHHHIVGHSDMGRRASFVFLQLLAASLILSGEGVLLIFCVLGCVCVCDLGRVEHKKDGR